MAEMLSYSFVRLGLGAAVVIGATCSLVGVFVVLRGMSYLGAGIGHGCLAGVALAFLMGWNPLAASIVAALLMVFLIEGVGSHSRLKMDTSIGVIFSLAMATAVLFIGMLKKYTPDLMGYLFGNLLRVSAGDLRVMIIVGILVAGVIALFFKELQFSTFDPEMAKAFGIPSGMITLLLTVLMGLTIVISLQAVGELLVLALIVLPASTARLITRSLRTMIGISVALGVSASVIGLVVAFHLDVPSGSTIVLMLGVLFFIALFTSGEKVKLPSEAKAGLENNPTSLP